MACAPIGASERKSLRIPNRALALAVFGAIATAPIASATPSEASRPLLELFPGLDRYLKAPETKRSMFRMRYCVQASNGDAPSLQVRYDMADYNVTLETDETSCFPVLPALNDLKANPAAFASAPDSAFKMIIALEPSTPLQRVIPLQDLREAILQADAAARDAAGPFAWGAPHLDSVHFDLASQDPPARAQDHDATLQNIGLEQAPSGFAIFADGARKPLPVRDGRVMVAPDHPSIRAAQWIELASDPLTARIGFSTPIKR